MIKNNVRWLKHWFIETLKIIINDLNYYNVCLENSIKNVYDY